MRAVAVLLVVLVGTAAAAELTGSRVAVYSGSGGGLLLGIVGYGFARKIAALHRAERETREKVLGRSDVWTIWVGGLLVRLVLMGILAGAFLGLLEQGWRTALLSMACVYLLLLLIETWWLMLEMVGPEKRNGT